MRCESAIHSCGVWPIDAQMATNWMNLPIKYFPMQAVDPLEATEHALNDARFLTEALVATAALAVDEEGCEGKGLALPLPSWLGHGETDMHHQGCTNPVPEQAIYTSFVWLQISLGI